MIRNRNQFLVNSETDHIDTRQYAKFQKTFCEFDKISKECGSYLRINLFNLLPAYIKMESYNHKKLNCFTEIFV